MAKKNFKKAATRIAVYPGSFDPITMGHVDIVERIAAAFDEVVVLISESTQKSSLFTREERKKLIQSVFSERKNIIVDTWDGLTVDYLAKINAGIIVRGLRAVVDFEYEMTMASMNKKLAPQVETMLVFASPEYYFISSRGVKEVAKNGGSLAGLVPDVVSQALAIKLKKRLAKKAKKS